MESEFRMRRRVEFSETDMAGIMHFSNTFLWMESCETAFYRSLGFPLIAFQPGVFSGWPRVKATCEYRSPFRFGEEVEIRLTVTEIRTRAIVYSFHFHRIVGRRAEAKASATGEITAVYVSVDPKTGIMTSTPIPQNVRSKIGTVLAKAQVVKSSRAKG